MNTHTSKLVGIASLLTALLLGSGCTTTKSAKASPLKPTVGTNVDLTKYQTVSVTPFKMPTDQKKNDPAFGEKFAADIAVRLREDFGVLFKDVRTAEPVGSPDELIVTGNIKSYKPGNRFGRAMLIGVTPAVFKADLILQDASTKQELLVAPIDKLWAWGGIMGASKGIEEMTLESAAAAANTIARAKGWKGDASQPKAKGATP